jgi:hypothetical protein
MPPPGRLRALGPSPPDGRLPPPPGFSSFLDPPPSPRKDEERPLLLLILTPVVGQGEVSTQSPGKEHIILKHSRSQGFMPSETL